MKNSLVRYQEALALKELGFNEPCLFYFKPRTEQICMYLQDFNEGIEQMSLVRNSDKFLIGAAAPTYEQTFRFLIGQVDSARWEVSIDVHSWYLFDKQEIKHYADFIAIQKLIEIIKKEKG